MRLFDEGAYRKGTASIKWDFQKQEYGTDGLLPFSIADADYPIYKPVLEAIKLRIDNGVLGYTDADKSYFAAVSGWAFRRHGWTINNNWIVPVSSIVPGIANLIEVFTNPGDKIIVQPPVYAPFYSVVNATGRELIKNGLILSGGRYIMDYKGLEKACAGGAKMLILCSPHNPVCRLWSEEELIALSEICFKYCVIVVSDEIHWDLALGGGKHFTMGRVNKLHEQLIVCTSCSKTFNIAGLQTSNFIIPDKFLRDKFKNWLYGRYMFCPNALGMEAVKAAYTYGDRWADEQQAYLTENAYLVRDFMSDHLPRVKLAQPEATYLLWLDMRAYGLSSEELVRLIARAGAALNSGLHYGGGYDGFLRMNVACPQKQLYSGLECIKIALS